MLDAIANSSFATWVNASAGWPLALTIHAFGTAIVVGLMFIIGLRLLGLFRTIPYTSLNTLIPLIWIAVVVYLLIALWMLTRKSMSLLHTKAKAVITAPS